MLKPAIRISYRIAREMKPFPNFWIGFHPTCLYVRFHRLPSFCVAHELFATYDQAGREDRFWTYQDQQTGISESGFRTV